MSKFAITVDGTQKLGKPATLTVNGVHRKIKGAYLTVNGLFQKCYSAGVVWKKYNCYQTETYLHEDYSSAADGANTIVSYSTVYSSYDFSEELGYYGCDIEANTDSDTYCVGFYYIDSYMEGTDVVNVVYELMSDLGGGEYYAEAVAASIGYPQGYVYEKGSTYYGDITADEGTQPEDGTVVAGDINGSWCVVYRYDGQYWRYYYYEKA